MRRTARFGKQFYDRHYRNRRTRVVTRAEMARRAELIAAFVRHGELRVRRILDAGCGLGLMRAPLLERCPAPVTRDSRPARISASDTAGSRARWQPGRNPTRFSSWFVTTSCSSSSLATPAEAIRGSADLQRRAALRRADARRLAGVLRSTADRPRGSPAFGRFVPVTSPARFVNAGSGMFVRRGDLFISGRSSGCRPRRSGGELDDAAVADGSIPWHLTWTVWRPQNQEPEGE